MHDHIHTHWSHTDQDLMHLFDQAAEVVWDGSTNGQPSDGQPMDIDLFPNPLPVMPEPREPDATKQVEEETSAEAEEKPPEVEGNFEEVSEAEEEKTKDAEKDYREPEEETAPEEDTKKN